MTMFDYVMNYFIEKNMVLFATPRRNVLNGHSNISRQVKILFPEVLPYYGERYTTFRVCACAHLLQQDYSEIDSH